MPLDINVFNFKLSPFGRGKKQSRAARFESDAKVLHDAFYEPARDAIGLLRSLAVVGRAPTATVAEITQLEHLRNRAYGEQARLEACFRPGSRVAEASRAVVKSIDLGRVTLEPNAVISPGQVDRGRDQADKALGVFASEVMRRRERGCPESKLRILLRRRVRRLRHRRRRQRGGYVTRV